MDPKIQNKLEALLVAVFDEAAEADVPPEQLQSWLDNEVPYQLKQYAESGDL